MNNLADESKPSSKGEKKRFGCLKTGLLLLLLLLVILHFAVSAIGRRVANSTLPEVLGTEAHLDGLTLNLLTGRVGLTGLSIQQPEGFEGAPLLEMKRFSTSAPVSRALRQNPVTVNRVHVDGLTLRVISDAEGVLNLTKIGPTPEGEDEVEEVVEAVGSPPVWVKKVLLENISLFFTDAAHDWNVEIRDLTFELRDLRIAGAKGAEGPATFEGSLEIVGPKTAASILLKGKVGMILPDQPDRAPPMQVAMGLIGFDLDIVDPFLARGARTTLGGGALDFVLFMEIGGGGGPAEQTLYGSYALGTDEGHGYAGLLGGTLEAPELPFLNLLGDVLGNQFGRVVRLGGNIATGGLDTARAAADTGIAAARGAANTVTGAAGGLFRTMRGVVTLDGDEALGGLRDATVGTIENAVDTVTDTAGTASDGLERAAGSALGLERVPAWWAGVDERIAAFETAAEEWFAERPFPE